MAELNDDLIRQTRETAVAVEDALRSIASKIGDIFEETLLGANDLSRAFSKSLTKDITSSLNSLAKISTQLESNQVKLNAGSLKRSDIEKQILERKIKQNTLEAQLTIAANNDLITQEEKTRLLEEQEGITKQLTDQFEKQAEQADIINKKIGLTGGILKGFSKIPILGNLIKSEEVLARIQKEAGKDTSTRFSVFKEGVKGIGSSIMENLTSPFALATAGITALVKIFQFFIDAMFAADKRVTDIAKNISISKDSARALYESFQESKGVLDSQLATTKNITEAFNELANISDFTNISNIKQLDTQIQLTKEIGIQVEEALQLQQLFAVNNNEADKGLDIVYDQIAAFANQNKIVADGRKIISDVNKLSGLIKLNFRGNTGEIVKTVLEAKKLGLTLDQITKTQSSLLDFESSISSQIEAELLTGRQINLERARLFALNNDIAGLTEEIAKQNITAASFSRMNALQQESIAKTLGMSANELGDSLFKQELINKTAGDYTKNLRENAKILRDQGKLEEANRLERQAEAVEQGIVEGKSLEQAQKSLDAQTKFNNALEHAQEIFTDLVDGGFLDKLSDTLIALTKSLEGGLLGLFNMSSNIRIAESDRLLKELDKKSSTDAKLKQRLDDLRLLFKNSGIGENKLADRASASISSLAREQGLKVDDFVIKTHPKDTLVMAGGTKLGNNDETLKAQQETNILLRQLLTKNTNIYMDSNKVSTTISQNSFNVGQ